MSSRGFLGERLQSKVKDLIIQRKYNKSFYLLEKTFPKELSFIPLCVQVLS